MIEKGLAVAIEIEDRTYLGEVLDDGQGSYDGRFTVVKTSQVFYTGRNHVFWLEGADGPETEIEYRGHEVSFPLDRATVTRWPHPLPTESVNKKTAAGTNEG